MSLKKETIKQAVLHLENVIEESKKHNQTLIAKELEEILQSLKTELNSESIDSMVYIRLLDFLLQLYDLF